MRGRAIGSMMAVLALTACATLQRMAGKPVLTRGDFARLARHCKVAAAFFGQPRDHLPHVVFTFADGGVPDARGVLPPV